MSVLNILEWLVPFKARHSSTKWLLEKLEPIDLQSLIEAEKARLRARGPARPSSVQEDIVQHLFDTGQAGNEGLLVPGMKEYFHVENRQGKHCWEERQRRELEQGIHNTDKGSPMFAAQRKSICSECGQAIEPGDGTVLRSKERGVA